MATLPDDERLMAEAIRIGRTHLGQTSTNPSVGCLIVKDGEIVGEAVTAIGGRPHAETQALANAGEKARGATAYVTLEPCAHHGKTPPCANALIQAGVTRVVVALADPDPRVSGRGFAMLREAGVEVDIGVLAEEAGRALAGYLMRQTENRPYVTLKLAISADGNIGQKGQGQVRITGDESRVEVQHMRAESDAILVGIGTAIADDPLLTCRLPEFQGRSPVRIVLDENLDLPLTAKLVETVSDVPVIVVAKEPPLFDESEDEGFNARREALSDAGVEVLQCNGRAVDELLLALSSRGISSLLIEGGARVARNFLDAGLIDRLVLFEGPADIGEEGIESPVTRHDIPAGFVKIRDAQFGADRYEEFERSS